MPNGGFLLKIISIRWASVSSNASRLVIPAADNFLTATTPI